MHRDIPRRRWRQTLVVSLSAATVLAAHAMHAQCVPPANTNEAKLLAFYEAPIIFAPATGPMVLAPLHVALTGEVTGIPTPSASLQHTDFCYFSKQEGTHLSPVLPRLRVAIGLPLGFAIEGSYEPPITIDEATPNFGSLALSYTNQITRRLIVSGRFDGTTGITKGPITCPKQALQLTDVNQPCYGTKPSDDTFYPKSLDLDGSLGYVIPAVDDRITVYGGSGYAWLFPRFRVGFTSGLGATDNTMVLVDLRRASVFGGVDVRLLTSFDVGAQVYSQPADLTTWRLTARFRI
jgi:hypothetical protein